ncbi:M50 family metallopeptidase [Paraburkholderia sp. A3RO-2L]|uniref:M50 family metallopeptidase n=1 Tax=unclassified Paraburkholderia TaxID=2615204 RepID=UPI003DAA2184
MEIMKTIWWVVKELFTQYPLELFVISFFKYWLIAIHEIGHAVVGAFCGLRSTGIRIGDKPVLTVTIRGYRITIGRRAHSGHVTFVDEGNFQDTWQVFATYLAGPLAVIIAGPVFFVLLNPGHWYLAHVYSIVLVLCGFYDLRKTCPDGKAIRRLWVVLRNPVCAG